ncbi:MAG TPA: hypothetical protein VGI66_16730 [Streptosporangiaceae bacterium]
MPALLSGSGSDPRGIEQPYGYISLDDITFSWMCLGRPGSQLVGQPLR